MNAPDAKNFDAVVIGAGIAGATAAAHLAADRRVALIEAEDSAGYHTTGRSVALWFQNFGPPDVRAMTAASRAFFENPPPGFAEAPLMAPRGVMMLAPPGQEAMLGEMLDGGSGLRALTPAQARDLVPALRPGYAVAAAIEDDAFDMDVASLLQGFLRQLRRLGGQLALRSRAGRIERRGGAWHVEVTGGAVFSAPIVVNAAGAWGDEVAAQAGLALLGLQPKRRTAALIDPAPWSVAGWPAVGDVAGTWYARAEARTKFVVSPADETPMSPQDIQPDDLDVAIGIDRMQQALDIEVRRVEHARAGLRSFLTDGSFALGWDGSAEGFFWNIGQGGYGIQTSPAAGRLVADLVAGRDPGELGRILACIDPRRLAAAAVQRG
jgi:D-arginine dehydrogenase